MYMSTCPCMHRYTHLYEQTQLMVQVRVGHTSVCWLSIRLTLLFCACFSFLSVMWETIQPGVRCGRSCTRWNDKGRRQRKTTPLNGCSLFHLLLDFFIACLFFDISLLVWVHCLNCSGCAALLSGEMVRAAIWGEYMGAPGESFISCTLSGFNPVKVPYNKWTIFGQWDLRTLSMTAEHCIPIPRTSTYSTHSNHSLHSMLHFLLQITYWLLFSWTVLKSSLSWP